MHRALVVAVHRVAADQREVDRPFTERHAGMVADRLPHLGDRRGEGGALRERVHGKACVEPLGELAPVGQSGVRDLLVREHVHGPTLPSQRRLRTEKRRTLTRRRDPE